MRYPNKKQKPFKTPLPKGVLNYCPSCVYYIHQEPDQPKIKYPCRKSHQQVRKAAGINYARDFRDCALYEKAILFPDINYVRHRIMSMEKRQEEIAEYKVKTLHRINNVKEEVDIIEKDVLNFYKYLNKYNIEREINTNEAMLVVIMVALFLVLLIAIRTGSTL